MEAIAEPYTVERIWYTDNASHTIDIIRQAAALLLLRLERQKHKSLSELGQHSKLSKFIQVDLLGTMLLNEQNWRWYKQPTTASNPQHVTS